LERSLSSGASARKSDVDAVKNDQGDVWGGGRAEPVENLTKFTKKKKTFARAGDAGGWNRL